MKSCKDVRKHVGQAFYLSYNAENMPQPSAIVLFGLPQGPRRYKKCMGYNNLNLRK